MDWIERLNEAIRYIEENLTGEIEYEKLGQIACCSAYHFQRMFAYIAGMPLSEYIRKRKMSLAAVDLQGSDAKIIDVAAKYGYASPTAFNRAFQSVHGVNPSSVKSEGIAIKSFPPITIKITVKGVEEMNYRIEAKESFAINFVAIEPGTIAMPAGNPRSQELLEKNGIKVIPVEFDEIMKGFGAIHCCTAFLKRG